MTEHIQDLPVRRQLHFGRWVAAGVVLFVVGAFLRLVVTDPDMGWEIVWSYMFDANILSGIMKTLQLSVLAIVIGTACGVVIAVMRLSNNPVMSTVSWVWVWFFRGVPPLVSLLLWYNVASLIDTIDLKVPFGPTLASWETNELITPFIAAIIGLSLTESAYAAEIIRGGIQAVRPGEVEASASLGMTPALTMRRIVLPQAFRIVLPPMSNQVISMLKFSSLVSVMAVPELLYSAQQIYSVNYQTIPLLLVATIWYVILTTVLTVVQQMIERRLAGRRRTLSSRRSEV